MSELVRRAGSQVELARKSGLSDRTIRDYLTGKAKPKGETAQRLAAAGGVRLEWLLTGAEPMGEEGAPAVAEQPRPAYAAINLKRLAVAIGAVEARMPLIGLDAKAGVIAACYDHLMSRDSADPGVLSGFLDLIAPVPAAAYKVGQPLSDEEVLGARSRKTAPKK